MSRSHWLGLAALTTIAGVAYVVRAPTAKAPAAPRRIAIRVPCGATSAANAPSACPLANAVAVDVWSEDEGPNVPLDIVVTPAGLATLRDAHVTWETLVPDVDAAAAAEAARLHAPSFARPGDWFAEFRDFAAIRAELADLARVAPARAELSTIGTSIEGRPILALHIGTHHADGAAADHRMIITGTQHAREWIAAMVTTCVADRLVRDYDRDPAIRDFVDHADLWVVPVVNPDGYDYTWTRDRYWRKNRHDRWGVDLNRNFDIAFGGPGSSSSKLSPTYHGERAFSEPESAALRDLALRVQPDLHIDSHSYGQLILYPWGYTSKPSPLDDEFAALGARLATTMRAAHDTAYSPMPASELYAASGTLTDWMYGVAHARSFTIELRPRGGSGFVLPPEQIRPTCDEGLAAVLALRASAASPRD